MSCPVISCKNGKVKGCLSSVVPKGFKPVYVYRNIPFAKPPVGNLRFMQPQEADPWDGVLDGTVPSKCPMQSRSHLEMMNEMLVFEILHEQIPGEDCLTATVYTPDATRGKNLPVLVFFYGGGFQMGNELTYDGSILASMNDVVVVIPNYRTNAFGFFSLGKNSICPGNAGLHDQHAALKWVRNNIEAFGGDSSNVTISGESSGAISVDIHVNSPMSRGLFHKAISYSGQATAEEVFNSDLSEPRKILLQELGLEGKSDQETLEALQKLDAETLLKAIENQEITNAASTFIPMVDGKFVSKHPLQTLADKDFNNVPYIIGTNSTECFGMMGMFSSPDFATGISESSLVDTWKQFGVRTNTKVLKAWKKFYVKDDSDPLRYSKMFGQVVHDSMFVVPAEQVARSHADVGHTVYYYQGAFRLRLFHDDDYRGEVDKLPDFCECDHGDDLYMTFGMPFMKKPLTKGAKFSDEERELSRTMMKYLTNFMKTGDPNKGVKVDVEWPKYKSNGKYISFGNPIKIGEKLAEGKYEFWTETIPALFKSQ